MGPVLRVASLDEAMQRANSIATGKPLVSYYYGQNESNMSAWISGTSSGSLAINAGPMRMQGNYNAAIHGVGNSGLGGASIWGEHVFDTFSHRKHVVKPKNGAFAGSVWGAGPIPAAPKRFADNWFRKFDKPSGGFIDAKGGAMRLPLRL